MKNILFYFTGTGNSKQIAQDIAERLDSCAAFNIAEFEVSAPVEAESIGFVFPVYWGGLPKIAHNFMERLQITGSPYIYFAANCGASTGAIFKQMKKYIKKAGQTLSAGFSILMPENYIVLYEPFNEEVQKELFDMEKMKVDKIVQKVREQQPQRFENVGNGMFRMTAKGLNKTFIKDAAARDAGFTVSDACTACGKCESYCSVDNISMKDGKPTWNHNCQFCMGCINVCPSKAIDYQDATQERGRYINPNVQR